VGGDPAIPGVLLDRFHEKMSERSERWPHDMSTTGTHDTKRGEDLRARLNVLSEIPQEWEEAIWRWKSLNASARTELDGAAAPDANEEYLIYQTLVGTWPLPRLDDPARQHYVDRIVAYLDKALREAKAHTSWLNPYEEYDQAVAGFIRKILENLESPFVQELDGFVRTIADTGFVNSLAQTLLKICTPGVPDFYQGVELWDFNLVDPDNRRPVDFATRVRALAWLDARAKEDLSQLAGELLTAWPDERAKMFVTWRSLGFRRDHPDVFQDEYRPLVVDGTRNPHVCAFARVAGRKWALCLVPRLSHQACRQRQESATASKGRTGGPRWPIAQWWRDTVVVLPPEAPARWRHVLTGDVISSGGYGGGTRALDVETVFRHFPVALLSADGA
jgi:(1->4)-alpha-D-glucan 1-alpha-D-glucosylmutase